MVACVLERYWPTYVVASFVSLIGGAVILATIRIVTFLYVRSSSYHEKMRGTKRILSHLQMYSEAVLYGSTLTSKFIVSLSYHDFVCVCEGDRGLGFEKLIYYEW